MNTQSMIGLLCLVLMMGSDGARIKQRKTIEASSPDGGQGKDEPDPATFFGPPGLCDSDVVKETCVLVNRRGSAAAGRKLSEEQIGFSSYETFTYVSSLLEMLSSDDRSMIAVMKEMVDAGDSTVQELYNAMKDKVAQEDADPNASKMKFMVNCADICKAVTRHIASYTALPPASDTGCYEEEDGSVRCDLDLSTGAVREILDMSKNLPDFHQGEPAAVSQNAQVQAYEGGDVSAETIEDEATVTQGMKQGMDLNGNKIGYTSRDLLRRLANIFRIYPMNEVSFSSGNEDPGTPRGSLLNTTVSLPPGWRMRQDSRGRTYYSHDELDPQYAVPEDLPPGWEAHKSRSTGKTYYSHAVHGSQYERPTFVTREGWHAQPAWQERDPTQWPMPSGWRESGTDGYGRTIYRHPDGQRTIERPGWDRPIASWRTGIQKRAQQAQAAINAAIRYHHQSHAQGLQDKWFGSSSTWAEELSRVLNSVESMLGNVEYVYDVSKQNNDGDVCQKNTFAYVYPTSGEGMTKTRAGQYMFYLCDLNFKSALSVQVETLIHEGSHHATSYTNDECMDEFDTPPYTPSEYREIPKWAGVTLDASYNIRTADKGMVVGLVMQIKRNTVVIQVNPPTDCKSKAYGRQTCEDLATKGTGLKAIRNADSFCYYVQDIGEAASPGGPLSAARRPIVRPSGRF